MLIWLQEQINFKKLQQAMCCAKHCKGQTKSKQFEQLNEPVMQMKKPMFQIS